MSAVCKCCVLLVCQQLSCYGKHCQPHALRVLFTALHVAELHKPMCSSMQCEHATLVETNAMAMSHPEHSTLCCAVQGNSEHQFTLSCILACVTMLAWYARVFSSCSHCSGPLILQM